MSEVEELKSQLKSLRYHTFAHALHEFEKLSGLKREDIQEVWFNGGHGYVMCSVRTSSGDFYISDEMSAGFLLDWAKVNGKLVDRKEST